MRFGSRSKSGFDVVMRAVILALAAACLTLPSAQAQPASPQTANSAETTRVVIRVVGCGNCSIEVSANPTYGLSWVRRRSIRVKNGKAVFNVLSAHTVGMRFSVRYKNQGSIDNAANSVTVQHSTGTPGKRITKARVLKSAYSYGCWAGTSRSRVHLRMVVHKFKGRGYTGEQVTDEWSYFSPQLAHYGTWGSAGPAINYQDRPPCDGDWTGSGDTPEKFLQKVLDEFATGSRGVTSTLAAVPESAWNFWLTHATPATAGERRIAG